MCTLKFNSNATHAPLPAPTRPRPSHPQALPIRNAAHLVGLYGVAYTLWGALISWSAPACTNPVFAEVVPSQMRSIVYSFDRSFEGELWVGGWWVVGGCGASLGGGRACGLGIC